MSTRSSAPHAHGADICPDPSAHSKDSKLQDSASKAALYATSSPKSAPNPLGPDGKLSSASAAASLKYAQPHELPSFPSVGIDTGSSGNKAATLANANQKPFEHWQPELSSSASKAALLAHKDGGKLNLWQPTASESGLTAAGAAMGIKSSPQLDYGYTDDGRKRALLAATLSVSGRTKTPEQPAAKLYPDQENAAHNALNAASVAHRPSTRTSNYGPVSDPANEASRLSHGINFNKAMYGEHPPVDIEVQEQKYQAALRASSISIAKQMQEVQARKSEDQYYAGLVAEDKSHAARTGSKNTPDQIRAQALGYLNLQEAAQRLAAERLRKLDPDGVLAYREHWGTGLYAEQPKEKEEKQKSKLTSRAQRFLSPNYRGSQEDDFSSDSEADEAEAARIRGQMRGMNSELANIDAKKRETDRANLLAIAEKQVKARMAGMDEKVFKETGKASPALMAQWEEKARAKAAANNEERMKNFGKIHIGGGQYMDQSELDAIAQRRMQPTLDEITDTAEKQRARDAEIAADQKQRKHEAELQKAQDREEKAAQQQVKDDEKMQATFEKNQRKAEAAELKREQKAKEQEEKDLQKAQKRMQKEEAKQVKDEAKQAKDEAKRAKAAQKQAEKDRENEARLAKTAVVGGTAGGAAGAVAEAEKPETSHEETQAPSQPQDSVLGETVAHSTGTRTAHDSTPNDPPGVPTTFDRSEIPSSTAAAYEHETIQEEPPAAVHDELHDKSTEHTTAPVAAATTGATAAGLAATPVVAHEPEPSTTREETQDFAKDDPVEAEHSTTVVPVVAAAPIVPAAATVPASTAAEDTTVSAAGTNHGQTYTSSVQPEPAQATSAAPAADAASPKADRTAKRGSFFSRFRRSNDEPSAERPSESALASESRLKSPVKEESSNKTGRKSKDREPGTLRKLSRAINDPHEAQTAEGGAATEHPLKAVDKSELNVTGSKDGPHRNLKLFSKFKQAINDPQSAQERTPERGAATEHQLQAVEDPTASSTAAGKARARSPSPDISPLEEERRDRKASVESDVFQEAHDRFDEGPATTTTARPSNTESKFHEEV